ncbi:glycosyltransferase [Natronosporangium hydrolyticum]|uniref:Glycosyltransferase n=1 Tax=Natronosporangium hydrolyticum TaxID=2811111 RepID=A0A895YFE1_9ACTN|nr:glycosyltransferase [Natronosporangium hydrolyticum]
MTSVAPSRSVPAVSVVIPTYNRAELLARTLESLAAQRFPAGMLEVVVADDGSSDATAQVVRTVADRLPARYYRQADRGFRAASARNGGARLASAPVLVFLDTGTLAGPEFARAHYDAHRLGGESAGPGSAVLGYVYGYHPDDPLTGLGELLVSHGPEQVVDRLRDQPSFRDVRHAELAEADFDLGRLTTPWSLCWSVNVSVHADDFWAVGGFDEDFTGYGFEDVEFGYRLARSGVAFTASRDAWGVETPHDRSAASSVSWLRNLRRLLDKHRCPGVPGAGALAVAGTRHGRTRGAGGREHRDGPGPDRRVRLRGHGAGVVAARRGADRFRQRPAGARRGGAARRPPGACDRHPHPVPGRVLRSGRHLLAPGRAVGPARRAPAGRGTPDRPRGPRPPATPGPLAAMPVRRCRAPRGRSRGCGALQQFGQRPRRGGTEDHAHGHRHPAPRARGLRQPDREDGCPATEEEVGVGVEAWPAQHVAPCLQELRR